jgi:hypothetical protein
MNNNTVTQFGLSLDDSALGIARAVLADKAQLVAASVAHAKALVVDAQRALDAAVAGCKKLDAIQGFEFYSDAHTLWVTSKRLEAAADTLDNWI